MPVIIIRWRGKRRGKKRNEEILGRQRIVFLGARGTGRAAQRGELAVAPPVPRRQCVSTAAGPGQVLREGRNEDRSGEWGRERGL